MRTFLRLVDEQKSCVIWVHLFLAITLRKSDLIYDLGSGLRRNDGNSMSYRENKFTLDQSLFTVEVKTFRQFCELLDAPVKYNPGLARLMTFTPPWSRAADIEGAGETK